jgi:hypothetical protein
VQTGRYARYAEQIKRVALIVAYIPNTLPRRWARKLQVKSDRD